MRRIVLSITSVLLAVGVVAVGFPAVTALDWTVIWSQRPSLPWSVLLGLIALWLFGLWIYTFVLTASLPGLSHTRAFTLNAVGSAVGNVLPLGGAAGVATTFLLASQWGLRARAVTASVVVTGIWNILAGLAAPAVALALLALSGEPITSELTVAFLAASALLVAALVAMVVALCWEAGGLRLVAVVDRLVKALPRTVRPKPDRLRQWLVETRQRCGDVVQEKWWQLSVGVVGYVVMQAVLFGACLSLAGVHVGGVEGFAAFALGRMLARVVVTPGGAGISETGTVALLVAFGAPPGPAAVGVLLFAMFVYVLEIPLGGVVWALSSLLPRQRRIAGH